MSKNILLLYSFENMEGMIERNFEWFETEQQLKENIEDKKEYIKDFTVNKIMEVLQYRNIKI